MMRNFKTERELEPNASRNCFWDGYLERSVSYRPIFFLYLVTVPEVFAKVNSAQLPFRFWRDEFILQIMNLCLQYLSH